MNMVATDARMRKHVVVVAALHIGFGIIGLIGAAAIFFGITFAKGFIPKDEMPRMILNFLAFSLPLLIGFLATLGLVGGWVCFSLSHGPGTW